MKHALASLLALTLLAGCGKDDPAPTPAGGGSGTPSTPAAKYGTPEDTAKTFFAACKAADWPGVSACIHKTAPGIGEIRDMKLSEGEKKKFQEGLGAAKVGNTTKDADGKKATVEFTAMKGDKEKSGKIIVELEGSDWKITDLD